MLIVLSEQHKADLAFLSTLSDAFFTEFCKITVGFLLKGEDKATSKKLFASTSPAASFLAFNRRCGEKTRSEALGCGKRDLWFIFFPNLRSILKLAMSFLWLEAAKAKLSRGDFHDSLAPLGIFISRQALNLTGRFSRGPQ